MEQGIRRSEPHFGDEIALAARVVDRPNFGQSSQVVGHPVKLCEIDPQRKECDGGKAYLGRVGDGRNVDDILRNHPIQPLADRGLRYAQLPGNLHVRRPAILL